MTRNEQIYIIELGKERNIKVERVKSDAVRLNSPLGQGQLVTSIFSLAESIINNSPEA